MKKGIYFLAGDIGGTNTKLGIFSLNGKIKMRVLMRFKSNDYESIFPILKEILDYAKKYDIKIKKACFSVAGPVSADRSFCNLTYVRWNVDANDIMRKFGINIFLINDFEAVGYGINVLGNKDIISIRKNRKPVFGATKAIIGAGTGLGKSILVHNDKDEDYRPIPSEGGFSDFPAQNEFDISLINFIKRKRKMKAPVSCEEMISGKGIESIYYFLKSIDTLKKKKCVDKINKSEDGAASIMKYASKDKVCRETFKIYSRFYARIAKNFVLDSLALGGLYIAGGIAAKNKRIFEKKEFIEEFEKVDKQKWILKRVPIYLILNPDVGLYGAAYAAVKI